MRALTCPICNALSGFASQHCPRCGTAVGLHLPSRSLVVASEEGVEIAGRRWERCSSWSRTRCNWMTPSELGANEAGMRGLCFADSLVRRAPDAADTIAVEKLAPTTRDLRMVLYQLIDLGLPVEPYWRAEGGMAFDLLSSLSAGKQVLIGHAGGVITIDLAETLDAYRERLRVQLGEPYRTMVGHFRHETGHYFQNVLVETGEGAGIYLDKCREVFGDERASYSAALDRHYRQGPPDDWRNSYISEYATMHPWEDFAECFAHYLHITGTIDTARESGLMLEKDQVRFSMDADIVPLQSYAGVPVEKLLYDWKWLSTMFNRVNEAMGSPPLYPFDIPQPVVRKLGFIHRVVRESAKRHPVTDPMVTDYA